MAYAHAQVIHVEITLFTCLYVLFTCMIMIMNHFEVRP